VRESPKGTGNYIQRGFAVKCQMKPDMRGDTIVFQLYLGNQRFRLRKLIDILVSPQEALNAARHSPARGQAIPPQLEEPNNDHQHHILKQLNKP